MRRSNSENPQRLTMRCSELGPICQLHRLSATIAFAASERVNQVFVRHVFRFWMGRNETINDAPILQDAYKAYRESNGKLLFFLFYTQ